MKIICCLGIVLLAVTFAAADSDYFNCRRNGQSCRAREQCQENGTCLCDSGYEGFDCRMKTSVRVPCPTCGSEGMCYASDNVVLCYCPPYLYGVACENKVYELSCDGTMTLTLKPVGEFQGVMYVEKKMGEEECTFSQSKLAVAAGSCGLTEKDGVRTLPIIIQFNEKFMTNLDIRLVATCAEGTNTVDVDSLYTVNSSDSQILKQNIDNVPIIDESHIHFEVNLKDGKEVSNPVSLSEELELVFTADTLDNGGYEALRVESCVADNGGVAGDKETVEIIKDGCPAEGIDKLMSLKPTISPLTTERFSLHAFKFNNKDDVTVTCIIKVCPEGKSKYCELNCTQRRRRRSADTPGATVQKSFTMQLKSP